MRRRINIIESLDWFTVSIYLALVLIGWVNIYAAVYQPEIASIFDVDYRCGKQFLWIMLAFILAIVVLIIDYRFYAFFSNILYAISILILASVLLFGREINGAKSWLVFGGISLQPSEFVKLTTALLLARVGSFHMFKISELKWIGISLGIIFLPMLLIGLQPDFGSVIVFFGFLFVLYREGFSSIVMFVCFYILVLFVLALVFSKVTLLIVSLAISLALYYYLEKKLKNMAIAGLIIFSVLLVFHLLNMFALEHRFDTYKVLLIGLGLVSAIFVWQALSKRLSNVILIFFFMVSSLFITYSVSYVFENVLEERHRMRINIVLGLEEDPYGVGYNVNQSKIAIGSGGFSGKGFLKGTQTKFKFVPEQTTDFIFCTIGEEWGFLGSMVTIGLFMALLLRLIFLAERQRSTFSRMYGYGVFSVFLLHFLVNIGMTIGLMPVIGIPLPFISYGGSSLWAFTIFLFIFIRLDASRSVYYK